MKRRLLMVVVALALLCGGCRTQAPALQPAELGEEEQKLLALVGSEDIHLWDFVPPQGAKTLHYRIAYYKDGEELRAVDENAYSFQLSGGAGRIGVSIAPGPNPQYRSSLGTVDFFDLPVLSDWRIEVEDKKSAQSSLFSAGYDFANVAATAPDYHVARYRLAQAVAPPEIGERYILLGLGLTSDEAGSLDVLAEDFEVLREFPFAYLLECWFA